MPLLLLLSLALERSGVSAATLGVRWRSFGRSLIMGTGICIADFWIGSLILGQDFAPWDVLVAAGWRAVTHWPLDLLVAVIGIGAGVLSEELLRFAVVLGVQSATGARWPGVLASLVLYLLTHAYLDVAQLWIIVPSAVMYSLYLLRRLDLPALLIAHAGYNVMHLVLNVGLTP